MTDLAGSTSAFAKLAVEDEAPPTPVPTHHSEQVLVQTPCPSAVLSEDADADIVVDGDLDPAERPRDQRPQLDAVGEAGYVRGLQHRAGLGVYLTGSTDADAAEVGLIGAGLLE